MVNDQRSITCALSVLMACTHTSMVAANSLRARDHILLNEHNEIKLADTMDESLHSYKTVESIDILQHAIKVKKGYHWSRALDEQAEEENNNNEEGEDNEENAEDEGDDGDDVEEEEEEENGDDAIADNDDNQQDEENGDDAVADAENDDNQQDDEYGDEEENEEDEDEEETEEEDNDNDNEEDSGSEDESEDQQFSIDFLKCVAFSIEPNVVNIEGMFENGEIDEEELAQLEKTVVTEMTSDLNTQESIVFFTAGYGADDEDREIFMISINDWIAASSGYDQICNALDEEDVDTVFSKISTEASVREQSEHVWYTGFNCKADGNGFKPQMFLDDTCNTFSSTLNQYYPFRKATDNDSMQVSSDLTRYMIEDVNDSTQDSQYCEESEFCDQVFRTSIELATCEEGDDKKRRLATYQLEYDVASNVEDACPSIQTAFGIEENYEYSIEEIEDMVVSWSNMKNGGQESDRRSLIPGINDLWFYLAGALVVACVWACLLNATKSSTIRKSSSSIATDDTKREPLMDNSIPQSESDIIQAYSAIECTLSKKREKKPKTEQKKTKISQFREHLKKSLSKDSLPKSDKSDQKAEI